MMSSGPTSPAPGPGRDLARYDPSYGPRLITPGRANAVTAGSGIPLEAGGPRPWLRGRFPDVDTDFDERWRREVRGAMKSTAKKTAANRSASGRPRKRA